MRARAARAYPRSRLRCGLHAVAASTVSGGSFISVGSLSRQARTGLHLSAQPVALPANLHGPIVDDPAPIFAQRSDNLPQMSVHLLSIHDALDLWWNVEPGIKTI